MPRRKEPKTIRYTLHTKTFSFGIIELPKDCLIVNFMRDDRGGKQFHRLTYLAPTLKSVEETKTEIETTELLPEPKTTRNTEL